MAADTSHSLNVTGVKELVRALKRAEGDLVSEFKQAGKDSAEIVATEARRLVPVITGKTRDSIRTGATTKSGVVRTGKKSLPGVGPTHFGFPSRGIQPNPFLYDALDDRAPEVERLFFERVEALASKIETQS